MTNQKKHSGLLNTAALFVIISLFATLTFEGIHKGHEEQCHQDGCFICLVLQIIHNTKKISEITPVTSVEFSFINLLNFLILSALVLSPITPVSQKVKLLI